jgi:hypothetical protein
MIGRFSVSVGQSGVAGLQTRRCRKTINKSGLSLNDFSSPAFAIRLQVSPRTGTFTVISQAPRMSAVRD